MYKRFLFFVLLLTGSVAFAQKNAPSSAPAKPKLVVGLVIDQMRWDYLYRFQARYGTGGFKRMLGQGFSFENTFIPYVPTYTAVGHTTIYTGGVPATHGIVGNNWFEKSIKKNMYCTEDSTVDGVGVSDWAGKMSPRNCWATTVTDELRLSNNFQSKVIGISLKDRGAILPAGQSANAAYWYEEKTGKWISSTFYMKELPKWVSDFNARDRGAELMKTDWNTLYPINTYTLSTADDKEYEGSIPGEKTNTFPHKLSAITTQKYLAIKYTPSGATLSFEFAKEAIVNEKLGAGSVTDFLALSISSTDYMGHTFGPNSIEAEDTYLRLDKDIADFLTYLDNKVGKGNYLVFLTADHGAAHVPGFLKEHNIPAGTFSDEGFRTELNKAISDSFGFANSIMNLQNYQLDLNTDSMEAKGIDVKAVKKFVLKRLRSKPFITTVFETTDANSTALPEPIKTMVINGYNPSRSGDIQFLVRPGYFDGYNKGTTHGLWNPYDSHIPLLFYGWGIRHGKSNRTTYMTDIAPTVAAKLQIQMPNASVGKVLEEVN
ncbi:alkaline phosphatase PafA [Ferruginibacter sp. HRS2-29]|uniref:alkaline phosphatase PafA n=1 Tax=Ferruginibacter sp. HRS2-29 TaxID=2487334 RepID=UPI0020CE348B|nr:alkaline phosphatase PafA [Ferruginibacter sp. HRS2-29]MCP9752637.1 alkaline phosphatase family protein [Ferruginibacter sp. HRS2-29]